MISVKFKRLVPDAKPPENQSGSDAGYDLSAIADFVLRPGERRLVGTGLALELPANTEAQIRPRSGLALKHGITVLNAPGTVDSQYRGEIGVILINHGDEPFSVKKGDRIAQLVVKYVERVCFIECGELSVTDRGRGGFGSTGV